MNVTKTKMGTPMLIFQALHSFHEITPHKIKKRFPTPQMNTQGFSFLITLIQSFITTTQIRWKEVLQCMYKVE